MQSFSSSKEAHVRGASGTAAGGPLGRIKGPAAWILSLPWGSSPLSVGKLGDPQQATVAACEVFESFYLPVLVDLVRV